MAAKLPPFNDEDLAVNHRLGYPKAYAKLCSSARAYPLGPPLSFLPYTLQPQEALRSNELAQLFPVVDTEAGPSANPRGYANLLWKQLDHLGNAGFDPALFRVDPYGNVLYLHADPASPLAWDVDHWFPCSRGGRALPSNLRLLQWQVCRRKKDKLEFLVPWWDLQLGISVNQFLSIFASTNSDFRNRAFSFLFSDGGGEELNALQTAESHTFPLHFAEMKQQVGPAPAAIVSTQRSSDASSVLRPLDANKSLRLASPFPGMKKMSSRDDENASRRVSKENEDPYQSITRARDSLKQREESKKKEAEMSQLEEELNELRRRNEADRVGLQDLEAMLIKRRRRVEKCRRLAEAQSSYRTALEKMIRDAMHQNVVYKEQIRLNQAAVSALTARLEAQRAMCDESEADLRRKYRQRDELEKNARPCWKEQARKRSRVDHALFEERYEDCVKAWTPMKKELRVFLEEEQRASQALHGEEEEDGEEEEEGEDDTIGDRIGVQMRRLAIGEGVYGNADEVNDENRRQEEDDEEHRKQVGKGNVEKWLQLMLENAKDGASSSSSVDSPEKEKDHGEEEIKYLRLRPREGRRRSASPGRGVGRRGGGESSRGFQSVPSSPVAAPGTKKSFNEANSMAPSSSSSSSNFIKSCIKRPVNK